MLPQVIADPGQLTILTKALADGHEAHIERGTQEYDHAGHLI